MAASGSTPTVTIRVDTGCASPAEFAATFSDMFPGSKMRVATHRGHARGEAVELYFALSTNEVVCRATCVVLDAMTPGSIAVHITTVDGQQLAGAEVSAGDQLGTIPANPLAFVTDDSLGSFVEHVLDENLMTPGGSGRAGAGAVPLSPPLGADAPSQLSPTSPPAQRINLTAVIIAAIAAMAVTAMVLIAFMRNQPTSSGASPGATAQLDSTTRPHVDAAVVPPSVADDQRGTAPDAAMPEKPDAGPQIVVDEPAGTSDGSAGSGRPAGGATDNGCELVVAGNPVRAEVLIDKVVVGVVPFSGRVPCGAHEVRVTSRGLRRHKQRVVFSPGRVATVTVELKPEVASMVVVSSPAGASVKIAGQVVGKTPVSVAVPEGESPLIEVSLDGYETWSGTRTAKGETTTVRVMLVPEGN